MALVWVIGDGLLTDYVSAELATACEIVRDRGFGEHVPEGTALALVLHDHWQPAVHEQAEALFQKVGIPWLPGFITFGEGVVGPLIVPGQPGCSQCADMRRLMAGNAGRDRKEMWSMRRRLADDDEQRRDAWASHIGLKQVAQVLSATVRRALQSGEVVSESSIYLINLNTLGTSRHFFLPESLCSVCRKSRSDSSTLAEMTLQPSPKVHQGRYRSRSMDDLKAILAKDYFDTRTGVLNARVYDLVGPFATVGVNLPIYTEDEATGGRAHSYAESQLTAILEGLERYCGTEPREKTTVVHDTYRNLENQAMNPVTVGMHAKNQYDWPNFPYQPFNPDRKMNWVWGYSFTQERPILVPESIAYYGLGCRDRFVYETSNGCALGGSLVEAILYGILEVVERDSFLMTWYAQLPVPRLDPYSAHDTELHLMVDRLTAITGYDLYLYNTTMENGIPSVWSIAKNRTSDGIHLICGAGAHLDPVRAAKGAIHEAAGMLVTMNEKLISHREKYEQMYDDSFLVQQMEDHSMLYALPQAEERLAFLLNQNREVQPFDAAFTSREYHDDLTDDLLDVLNVFRRLGLDVIVVDQTAPELRRNGLYCVKVLIPGMLPMTFGYHMTRLSGLERVFRVPVELGYKEGLLTMKHINPHPHPFP